MPSTSTLGMREENSSYLSENGAAKSSVQAWDALFKQTEKQRDLTVGKRHFESLQNKRPHPGWAKPQDNLLNFTRNKIFRSSLRRSLVRRALMDSLAFSWTNAGQRSKYWRSGATTWAEQKKIKISNTSNKKRLYLFPEGHHKYAVCAG